MTSQNPLVKPRPFKQVSGSCCWGQRLGLCGGIDLWVSREAIGGAGKSLPPTHTALGSLSPPFSGETTSPHLGGHPLAALGGPRGWSRHRGSWWVSWGPWMVGQAFHNPQHQDWSLAPPAPSQFGHPLAFLGGPRGWSRLRGSGGSTWGSGEACHIPSHRVLMLAHRHTLTPHHDSQVFAAAAGLAALFLRGGSNQKAQREESWEAR